MRLELAQTFRQAATMLRASADSVSALAGMFILMPGILSSWFTTDQPRLPQDATPAQTIAMQADWITANWLPITFNGLCVAFGSLAILSLLLDRRRPTVGEAMRYALAALPVYLLANVLQSVAVLIGMFALLVPGFYLIARLLCLASVAAVEQESNPLALLRRALAVTQGNGWRILMMLIVMLFVGIFAAKALVATVGVIAMLTLPPDLVRLLDIIARAVVESGVAMFTLAVGATIYERALAAGR